jgi:hypothetical protein
VDEMSYVKASPSGASSVPAMRALDSRCRELEFRPTHIRSMWKDTL